MIGPQRIVCLTAETVETLYILGAEDRIVGVTGYAVRPARVRREKPRVGAFTSANVPKILALEPDLVLTFSDLQADIAADLIRAGVAVHAFNQRSVAGIFEMIATLGVLVGHAAQADALIDELQDNISQARATAAGRVRPRVYFEEWDAPTIAGIAWVSELIAIAGGEDVFADRAQAQGAKGRILDSSDVIAARPDLIIASWCGKKVRPEKIAARPGWAAIPAVSRGRIIELKSPLVLAPGPAAVSDGLAAIAAAISETADAMETVA